MIINLFRIIFYLFFVQPVIEWGIHYILHEINNWYHKKHHIDYFNNKIVKLEKLPVFFIIVNIYLGQYVISMMMLKYFVVHSIIHRHPSLLKNLSRHHIFHHNNNKYNFGVSSIWVDRFFGTFMDNEEN